MPFLIYVLLGVFAGGASLDKLLASRHRMRLHDLAVRYWVKLEDTPVPDVLRLTARWILKITDKMGNRRTTSVLLYILATVSFVSIASLLEKHLSGGDWKQGANGDIWDIIPLPHIAVYLTVSAFDITDILAIISP